MWYLFFIRYHITYCTNRNESNGLFCYYIMQTTMWLLLPYPFTMWLFNVIFSNVTLLHFCRCTVRMYWVRATSHFIRFLTPKHSCTAVRFDNRILYNTGILHTTRWNEANNNNLFIFHYHWCGYLQFECEHSGWELFIKIPPIVIFYTV